MSPWIARCGLRSSRQRGAHGRTVFVNRLSDALIPVVLVISGCTSMHHISRPLEPPGAHWNVNAGDSVRLTMRDGQRHDVRVQSVDMNAIVTQDGVSYDLREIQAVERREFSPAKTIVLTVGLFAGTLLILFVAAYGAALGSI